MLLGQILYDLLGESLTNDSTKIASLQKLLGQSSYTSNIRMFKMITPFSVQ